MKYERLDCTIRDGGYINNWNFEDNFVQECYKCISNLGYNYFEIGFRTSKSHDTTFGKWYYSSDEDINKIINKTTKLCKIAVMVKINAVSINDFSLKSESYIDLVRVLVPRVMNSKKPVQSGFDYIALRTAYTLCYQLLELGYSVSLNLGCADMIQKHEIIIIYNVFKDILPSLKCIYLADTFGSFNCENVIKQIREFKKYGINKLGFHAHDNREDAYHKSVLAISNGCMIIDSCINGLGRGSGNLKTELLVSDFNDIFKLFKKYPYYFSKPKNLSNYYILSSLLKIHPTYVIQVEEYEKKKGVDYCIELLYSIHRYCKKYNNYTYDSNLVYKLI
jgi:4-hydroxy 2-oxovalerate aldolase